jgi:Ni2+-binding GTPase involved in maturation of urease and hydrogenase
MWLGVGAAAGSGATVWLRRRVDRLSRRMKPAQVAGEVVAMVDHSARSTAGRVRQSVDTGRSAARRREFDLRHELEGRDRKR